MNRIVPLISALAALVIGLTQLRHGIVPLLDTVTYWSGAESVARGDIFSTTLAPSFSNFSALDFLERNGSLPFVDFPVGYPFLAGILGALIGVRAAMQVLVLVALMAIAIGVATGCRPPTTSSPSTSSPSGSSSTGSSPTGRDPAGPGALPTIALGGIGVLLIMTPPVRLVTQGALSESLFCAAVLWLVISLARYRRGGSWTSVAILTVLASLLRFLGAPLAVLAGWERYRRTGQKLKSVAWTAALMAPAAINVFVSSAAGGGHSAGWRGLDRLDIETFVRSLGGWFDSRQGDIRRTYFTTDGPSWWSWPLAALWIAFIGWAILRTFTGALRPTQDFSVQRPTAPHSPLPASSELALTAAGIMTVGLFAGIMGFDALVIADNRLMLPSGILTISAVAWWMTSRPLVVAKSSQLNQALIVVVILGWAIVAVQPWQATEMFSDRRGDTPLVNKVSEIATAENSSVAVIITNDADAVHWGTGIPAAYTPMPVKPLSGELVDEIPLYRNLPCALMRFNGVIVISNESTFSATNRDLLKDEVEKGTLRADQDQFTTVYWPTMSACTFQTD